MSEQSDDGNTKKLIGAGVVFLLLVGSGAAFYLTGGIQTDDSAGFAYPDGADTEDIDMGVLGETHNSTLDETTFVYNFERVQERPEPTRTIRITNGYGENGVHARQNRNGRVYESYFSTDDNRVYEKNVIDGEVTYSSRQAERDQINRATGVKFLQAEFGQFETAFVNTTTLDETEVATYRFVAANDSSDVNSSLNVSGTVVVSENGYVKDAQLRLKSSGDTVQSQQFSITNVGTQTVSEPEWLDEAGA